MTLRSIERLVWYLFVATAAWQTRLILWHAGPPAGGFIEWHSMSLYLSDVLMLVLFGLATTSVLRGKSSLAISALALFLIFAAVSLFNADSIAIGVYQLLRLAQFIAFFFYLRNRALKIFDISATAAAFVLGALVQAGLGIAQYSLQHDVGLRWLGETLLNTNMQGVAVFFDSGAHKILRAYGTLPHPNVLAVYLMLALWVVAWLWTKHAKNRISAVVWSIAFIVLLVAFYLTFSRTMIATWVFASVVMVFILRNRLKHIIATTLIVSALFVVALWPQVQARLMLSSSDEAVQLRLDYTRDSLGSGSGKFLHINWFGVGIGNFTTWLARTQPNLPTYYLQPAHNMYLLIYSELGVFGLLSLFAFLLFTFLTCWRVYASNPALRVVMIAMLGSFCFIALFDHFFWTLQQGRILWWTVAALAAGALPATIGTHERTHRTT